MPQQASSENRNLDVRHWPLQIRMRRKIVSHGRWDAEQWLLEGCDSDRDARLEPLQFEEQAQGEGVSDFIWRGLALRLYRDERPAYRFNISSGDPKLFVVCNEDEDLMQPMLVTASQDEAASYMDGGEEDVFSMTMPQAIQCWIEGFIARHGEPDLAAGKSKRRHHGGPKQSKKGSPSAAEASHG